MSDLQASCPARRASFAKSKKPTRRRCEGPGARSRGNLGDDVQSAALTADELLDGGLMWRLHDNKGRIKDFLADRDCILRDIPLVVLVNEFSRGSAEFIGKPRSKTTTGPSSSALQVKAMVL